MSNELINFEFESSSVGIRVVEIDGEPWFVAKDVMLALEFAETSLDSVPQKIAHVPDEWKGRHPIPTPGGLQEILILSEQGLYFFVLRSDKPKALPFQKWLAGEVLPSLRKWGYYGTLNKTDRLRYYAALSKTVKQLEGAKTTLSQTVLLQQIEEIHSILRLKMPAITLVHKPAAQMQLATEEERVS